MATIYYDDLGRPLVDKDPDAILDYATDWTEWLAEINDAIVSHTIFVTGGLVASSSSHTNNVVVAFIAGGTIGVPASVTFRIATLGGRTDERTLQFNLVQR